MPNRVYMGDDIQRSEDGHPISKERHMATPLDGTGSSTYQQSVALGHYRRNTGGILGKYDRVRTRWEDTTTREATRSFLQLIATNTRERGARILDLGCGSGEGYELLTQVPEESTDLAQETRYVLPPRSISCYLGVDLSASMIEQGAANYQGVAEISFRQSDLREGLGSAAAEAPFDLYYSSYGSLSHLDDGGMEGLLRAIGRHASPGAYIVLDLLGRLSPEWPCYWGGASEEQFPYSMSYLNQGAAQAASVEQFLLRFWTAEQLRSLCQRLSSTGECSFHVEKIVDRSIFVGRHVDTNEYGSCVPPLRRAVNNLYQPDLRTDLDLLIARYREVDGAPEMNAFFNAFARHWNVLVSFTSACLHGMHIPPETMSDWSAHPPVLQQALREIYWATQVASSLQVDDARANFIEPLLACCLHRLETVLQPALGCGHGLIAIVRVTHE